MNANEIQISKVYAMKVGKNIIGIRIMGQTPDGGYNGINVNTDKTIHIKSPGCLCGPYKPKATKAAQVEKETTEPITDTSNKKERTQSKPGGLSCAVRILQEEARPLTCPEMVKLMHEKGYWKTDGKTPAATIYSAIITEIKKKGENARFRKTDRGKFELAK